MYIIFYNILEDPGIELSSRVSQVIRSTQKLLFRLSSQAKIMTNDGDETECGRPQEETITVPVQERIKAT